MQELEEDLEGERQGRTKSEKARQMAEQELEDLADRLEEQGGATMAQVELAKKRESELMKLKKELQEANLQHEQMVNTLKQKNQDLTNQFSDQTDSMNKIKSK